MAEAREIDVRQLMIGPESQGAILVLYKKMSNSRASEEALIEAGSGK